MKKDKDNKKKIKTNNEFELLKKLSSAKIYIVYILMTLLPIVLWFFLYDIIENSPVSFFNALLTSVVVAGLFGIISTAFLNKDSDAKTEKAIEKVKDEFKEIFNKTNEERCFYCSLDIQNVYGSRDRIPFAKYIAEAQSRIYILATNLKFFSQEQIPLSSIIDKAVDNPDLLVQVLAMNPNHEFVARRHKEVEHETKGAFFTEIKDALVESLRKISNAEKKATLPNLKVKLYDNSPTLMMFGFDDILIVSFILRAGKARDLIHLEFNTNAQKGNKTSKGFVNHFDAMWAEAMQIGYEEAKVIKFKY